MLPHKESCCRFFRIRKLTKGDSSKSFIVDVKKKGLFYMWNGGCGEHHVNTLQEANEYIEKYIAYDNKTYSVKSEII